MSSDLDRVISAHKAVQDVRYKKIVDQMATEGKRCLCLTDPPEEYLIDKFRSSGFTVDEKEDRYEAPHVWWLVCASNKK